MSKEEKIEFITSIWKGIGKALELDSDDDEKDEILLGLARLGERATRLPTTRANRKWMKEWRAEKENRGSFAFLNRELLLNDEASYRNYLRVSKSNFDMLLSLIKEDIQRSDTIMRKAIPAEEKLAMTLRFLATGESFVSLDYQTRISKSAICAIVPEVCEALFKRLKSTYLKFPSTSVEWEKIAKEFATKWQFPNCLGALDGKHVTFRSPRKDGAFYHNYKGTNSIILLALVDANCKFTFIDVGCNGRSNDSGVFLQSKLYKVIEEKAEIPQPSEVGNGRYLPYVIVADDAFPLHTNIMKPYPYHSKSQEKQQFNQRLSRGRHVVEHAFGILANRFRVLQTPINLKVKTVQSIVLACCALQNFLIEMGDANIDLNSNAEIATNNTNNSNVLYNPRRGEAEIIRQQFMAYFTQEGRVDWQLTN